ncbi:hypothetical protein [Streptomyces flaveolus]|uniref:hypothetical protein n=1 Tax=Streptomyces flaveolus TaxID=67297 RepID=UPI0036FE2A82
MDDFDFLHAVVRPPFGGAGNIHEITFSTLRRQGVTPRLFDRETERWSLHRSDSRKGRLDPPVVGGFPGDRGVFHGEDTYNDRPIRVHFARYRLGPHTARWEKGLSPDDGRSWESNWVMDITRTAQVDA